MIAPDFITEASPASPKPKHFALGLLLSFVVHAVILIQLEERYVAAIESPRPIQIAVQLAEQTLEPAQAPSQTRPATATDTAKPAPPTPQPVKAFSDPAPPIQTPREAPSHTVKLQPMDREAMRGIAAQLESEQAATMHTRSENGAIVVDKQLISKIASQRLKANTLLLPEAAGEPTGSFEGGRWASLVKMNGKCFRVVAADPLTPGSVEMWYPQACRD